MKAARPQQRERAQVEDVDGCDGEWERRRHRKPPEAWPCNCISSGGSPSTENKCRTEARQDERGRSASSSASSARTRKAGKSDTEKEARKWRRTDVQSLGRSLTATGPAATSFFQPASVRPQKYCGAARAEVGGQPRLGSRRSSRSEDPTAAGAAPREAEPVDDSHDWEGTESWEEAGVVGGGAAAERAREEEGDGAETAAAEEGAATGSPPNVSPAGRSRRTSSYPPTRKGTSSTHEATVYRKRDSCASIDNWAAS